MFSDPIDDPYGHDLHKPLSIRSPHRDTEPSWEINPPRPPYEVPVNPNSIFVH